jgi:hypothetical protein
LLDTGDGVQPFFPPEMALTDAAQPALCILHHRPGNWGSVPVVARHPQQGEAGSMNLIVQIDEAEAFDAAQHP